MMTIRFPESIESRRPCSESSQVTFSETLTVAKAKELKGTEIKYTAEVYRANWQEIRKAVVGEIVEDGSRKLLLSDKGEVIGYVCGEYVTLGDEDRYVTYEVADRYFAYTDSFAPDDIADQRENHRAAQNCIFGGSVDELEEKILAKHGGNVYGLDYYIKKVGTGELIKKGRVECKL